MGITAKSAKKCCKRFFYSIKQPTGAAVQVIINRLQMWYDYLNKYDQCLGEFVKKKKESIMSDLFTCGLYA